jgi:2,5-furandicarboxylate decarboxylase 1
MVDDLRSYLQYLRNQGSGELWEIDQPVSLDYQMTAYALELESQQYPPALLFNHVDGFDFPVVCNLFSSKQRLAEVLGLTEKNLVSGWPDVASRRIEPVVVDHAPVRDVIITGDDVDLWKYPFPTHFETDGGRYISSGVVIANDPDSGVGNLNYTRFQVKGKSVMGASLHSRGDLWNYQRRCEARGEALEIAVVIGVHPAISIAAATQLPIYEDELHLAGGILQKPVPVVKAETVNVMVPAYAEMVIEGTIEPEIREDEGPFGEYTGYSTDRSTRNVFKVSAITHRENPISHDIVPGMASDHLNLSKVSRVPRVFETVKKVFSNAVNITYPYSGTHFHCYLSMHDPIPGQAKQAAMLLFGLDPYLKMVIVVDDDIDVNDEQQVLWALATRFQSDRDLFRVEGVSTNLLDPSIRNGVSAKMGLDATRAPDFSGMNMTIPAALVEQVRADIQKRK